MTYIFPVDRASIHAVVLAGGYATRLWPITKNRPKMFLPVGETTEEDEKFGVVGALAQLAEREGIDGELRDSIIDRDTHPENLDRSGALIGAHTKIANGE
ncbi:N-acetylglucosamine-1-phosphate uridyltransferase [Halapricum desulfuricans]|uniref:N-acetylglucosamine-1-phosphate uridyltransferase n=1 Tax=Halapricum desulfuricans TaxID=2841257 RepID=A0A897NCJ0_9EURY|nr:N-acetylglucosamine-1-phosphate uridyltransferase [Halapricum desulfuricans]